MLPSPLMGQTRPANLRPRPPVGDVCQCCSHGSLRFWLRKVHGAWFGSDATERTDPDIQYSLSCCTPINNSLHLHR